MQLFRIAVPRALIAKVALYGGILVLLAAALTGFFLLINFMVELISLGPRDLVAPNPSEEENVSLPSGVGALVFAVAVVSIILGTAMLIALRGWKLPRPFAHSAGTLLVGGLIAGLIIGAGLFLSFSGVLGEGISYDQHEAQRSFVDPAGLAVLGLIFLSIVFVGIIMPRLLLPLLAVFLLAGFGFGLLEPKDLNGLHLFNRPSQLQNPLAYAITVDEYRRVDDTSEAESEIDSSLQTGSDSEQIDIIEAIVEEFRNALELAGTQPLPYGTVVSLDALTSAEQFHQPENQAVFRVTGAQHTSYLRTGTGDIYENGEWKQLDPIELPIDADAELPNEAAAAFVEELGKEEKRLALNRLGSVLLGSDRVGQGETIVERISVLPAGEFRAFGAGVIPTSSLLERISVDGTFHPYSLTFATPHSIYGYTWTSSVSQLPQDQVLASPGIKSATYLQLPEGLSARVHALANEIAGGQSLNEKVKSIELYLEKEYTFGIVMDDSGPLRPPEGRDPVAWFLFDSPMGDSRSFSSAFVILARAVGVPARVVSGWAIERSEQTQTVYLNQMHQWAEVALDESGWTTIDPTPGNGLEAAQPIFLSKEPDVVDTDDGTQQKDPRLEPALETLSSSDDPERRMDAIFELADIDEDAAWQALIYTALEDADTLVRDAASQALELEWNVDLWVLILRQHWEPSIRELAAETLGELGDLKASSPLADALWSDEAPTVREAAVNALVALGDKDAFAPLVQALMADNDPNVRIAIVDALIELGGREAIPPISQALASDSDPGVRMAVINRLVTLGGREAIAPLAQALMSDSEPNVRIAAVNALTELGGQEVIAPVIRALSNDDEADVRKVAAIALGKLGDPKASATLAAALRSDEDPTVRIAAARSLHSLGPTNRGPLIEALRNDPDEGVRGTAASILGSTKDNYALTALYAAMIGDVSSHVRALAATVVYGWSRWDLEEVLRGDYDSATRALAATLLGERREILSVPVLGEALNDQYEQVRTASLEALQIMGDISWLENGGGLISPDGSGLAFLPGTTALSKAPAAHEPVFEVENVQHANLLRTSVGSVYENGRWAFKGSTEWILYARSTEVPHDDEVGLHILSSLPQEYNVTVYPAGEFKEFLPGILPTSPYLRSISQDGQYNNENKVFLSSSSNSGYEWDSSIPDFPEDALRNASVRYENEYVGLPARYPERVFSLAERITSDQSSSYGKAVAIHEYLQTEYTYRAPDSQDDQNLPEGKDPVDWFLFEQREGTSGNFSSAFVVLARTLGIPARVVSGWAIAPTSERQTVYADQAHQWAEISLEGLGWITFDPTPGGAPSRVTIPGPSVDFGEDGSGTGLLELLSSLSDSDPSVREQALAELEKLAAEASLIDGVSGRAARWTDILELMQALTNANPELRERALAAVAKLMVRGSSVLDEDWAEVLELLEAIADADPAVQEWAVNALETLLEEAPSGNDEAEIRDQIHQAVQSLDSANPTERERAIDALNSLLADASSWAEGGGGSGVGWGWGEVQGLLQSLSDSNLAVRERAIEALEELAGRITQGIVEEKTWNHLNDLVESLSESDPSVREQALAKLEELAAEALLGEGVPGGIGGGTQMLKLVQSLANADPALRDRALAAVATLMVSGSSAPDDDWAEALELLETLAAADSAVQAWATDGLEKLLDVASSRISEAAIRAQIQQSVQSLNAVDSTTRERVIGALNELFGDGAFGGKGGGGAGVVGEWSQVSGLLQSLSDSDPAVRARALEALEMLADSVTMRSEGEKEWNQLNDLVESLSDPDPVVRDKALNALGGLGNVTLLENGGAIIGDGGQQGWATGTTTMQARNPDDDPLFILTGARNTSYLRMAVGDVYENGRWRQLDPASVPHSDDEDVSAEVFAELSSENGEFAFLPESRRNLELLSGFQTRASRVLTERIQVRPFDSHLQIPAGVAFTSLHLEDIVREGTYYPFSATFFAQEPTSSYSWRSSVPVYSSRSLNAADPVDDSTYTQLPGDLPERIKRLARRITLGHTSTYAKAQALEAYLSTRYTYRFVDGSTQRPPPGRDPVDWFLFDHREGTCGVFSSAFVVLARSIGIPARVVSGWAIQPSAGKQTVYTDQAHQWAEVALQGIGWVDFEPTGPNGAPSRISGRRSGSPNGGSGSQGGQISVRPAPLSTVTTITEWPDRIQRQTPFAVGGTVRTGTGIRVSGMTVQVFVNETKEHGGTKLGETVANRGTFQVEVEIPAFMELGPYQLLARAVGNERYLESWSDPDVGVYSSSGLALTGPKDIPVDVEAIFQGQFTEDTGEGRAGEELSVSIDGSRAFSVTTGPEGDFSFNRAFSDPGGHWVEVSFKGEEFLLETKARLDFTVTLPTNLSLSTPVQVAVGEEFQILGELHNIRGNALAGKSVILQIGDEPIQSVRTGSSGEFEISRSLMAAGVFQILAEFQGDGTVLSSSGMTWLTSIHLVDVSIKGPPRIDQGSGATFTGELTSETLSEVGQLSIVLEDSSGEQITTVTTGDAGTFEYSHPSFDDAGPQSITVRFLGDEFISPAEASIAFSVLAPTSLTIGGPSQIEQGMGGTFEGSITSGTLSPIGQLELVLEDSAGEQITTVTTGEDGAFEYSHPSFDDAGPQSITVRFLGDEFISSAEASIAFSVLAPTSLTIGGPSQMEQGTGGTFEGSITSGTLSPIGQLELVLEDSAGEQITTVTTGDAGAFEYSHPSFDDAGPQSITARFLGDEFISPAEASIAFSVLAPTSLTIGGPSQIERGKGGTFKGSITSGTLSPIGQLELVLEDSAGEQITTVTTGEDGAFEYSHLSFDDAGLQSITARFLGDEFISSAEASIAFVVQSPTSLTIGGPSLVSAGESIDITGTLLRDDGQPIPNAEIVTSSEDYPLLVTDTEGKFGWEIVTGPDVEAADGSVESELLVKVSFDGTDDLASASAEFQTAVGIPRIIVEPVESAARGGTLTLRGSALLGTRAMPGLEVAIGQSGTSRTNEAGEFIHSYVIPADASLGNEELEISESSLSVSVTVPVTIKSASNLIVVPLDKVRPGGLVRLNAILLDDEGSGIPNATVRSGQGVEAVTDDQGMALLELTVPESEDLLAVPVTFRFDGDSLNMPLTYFLSIPVTPVGFNWLLWVGIPALALSVTVVGYAGRRLRVSTFRKFVTRMVPTGEAKPESPPVEKLEVLLVEREDSPPLQPTHLAILFEKASPDLPDVWGVGEEITVGIHLTDEDGCDLPSELVQVSVGEEQQTPLTTDDKGCSVVIWTGHARADCEVMAEFVRNDERLPATATRGLRVVVFREEIVRLYNVFTKWVEPRISEFSKQLTPREVESRIIAEGLHVDEKALDQLISRFEEADYSEHTIARRHYEAMYRAWRTVVES